MCLDPVDISRISRHIFYQIFPGVVFGNLVPILKVTVGHASVLCITLTAGGMVIIYWLGCGCYVWSH